MGIAGLNKFLREICPHVYQKVELKDFAYQKCAIDTSLYLYKYMAIFGDGWMSAFVNLVVCLKSNHIHPCFIFDNGCPEEKLIERARRKESRCKIDDKVSALEHELTKYYSTGIFSQFLETVYTEKCLENKRSPKRLLSKRIVPNDDKIKKIEEELERISKQSIHVTNTDIATLKAFLTLMKIPYFDAVLEAETTCVDLCKQKKVDFVMSEDSDVFAYGCPITIKDVNTSDGTCVAVVYSDIINSLDMTESTFLDFCIMCGCDYNSNIPLLGCKKAYGFMKEYKSIDAFLTSAFTKDSSMLKYVRVRELFTDYSRCDYIVPYSETVETFDEISTFLFTKNIKYDGQKIRVAFSPSLFSV